MTGEQLRRHFNAAWTPEKYARFTHLLDAGLGIHVPFRHSETPCFFDHDLARRMCDSGAALIRQCLTVPGDPVPARFRVPNEAARPLFVQVDYGLVRDAAGNLHPRLVEIQAFPSLYAYQPYMAEKYLEAYALDPTLRYLLSNLDRPAYNAVLRRAIVGNADPAETILLEIDPDNQKTRCDFLETERLCGIRTVCITKLRKRGNRLHYDRDGVETPVRRIYNRCIVDELERRQAAIPFSWNDDLDVEWAGHPNWYFRISKYSIPFLHHETVPEAHFLDQLDRLPDDPENWVLKPLFSFAGLGVTVGPTLEQIEAKRRESGWLLQRRVHFDPVIETPHGPTKAEIRLMYLWLDEDPLPVNTIVRMGRGAQMGVDHNKNLEWVGASAAFYV
ncbi:MAG: hypothetical protein MUC42_14025 [Bryobacter sp.]|nr:hypothetical protein [Bryobacter sp.]